MTLAALAPNVLLQVAGSAQDNPLVQQVQLQRSFLEQLADISTILVSLALILMTYALVRALLAAREGQKTVIDMITRLRGDLGPAVHSMNNISANLSAVSNTVKRQVASLDDTVDIANDRMRRSVNIAYRRVRELDALLQVAQDEAEDLFLGAASSIHGLKKGTRGLVRRIKRRRYLRETEPDDRVAQQRPLWDDEVERVIEAEGRPGESHSASSEQGPTIHRRRSRIR